MKTLKTVTKIITLSLMTVTMASANKPTNFNPACEVGLASIETIYQTMSTSQLQRAVERHSKNDEVTFNMGIELMKRWTNS